jgi:hypothetical protein
MLDKTASNSSRLVAAIFCEPFSVASASAALLRGGFADCDIHAVGILEGHSAAVTEFLLAIGLPSDVVDFYRDCLDEGAVLLTVRVNGGGKRKKDAIELVKHYGGVCAPEKINHEHVSTCSATPEHHIDEESNL